MRLTRRYRFSASHRLDVPSLSPEENRKLFGKCNNPYGHGHDYVLEVTVEGAPDDSGQIARRGELDSFVREKVIARLDHQNLNSDVPELAGAPPTTENLAVATRAMLKRDWPFHARLARVRIAETDRNIFDLDG
ncbi:MAG TPA: 6-carboxytetrahydropterin synthase [Bryobacteraceae bacterium]|nr:6-carboxytetrahydropterin synthase [Bryobacteraceae bacterium]